MVNSEGALILEAWEHELSLSDPKRNFILQGVTEGFHIVDPSKIREQSIMQNYSSATSPPHRPAVENQIITEIENHRYLIVDTQPMITSALGAIPKKDGINVRLIHDCSRPVGGAVNDFADNSPFSYQCISDAVDLLQPGHYMAKLDLKEAYRSVKTHPTNWCATGLQWTFSNQDHPSFLIDTRLPFGAKRSPYIFTELTQAVRRIMSDKYQAQTVAYLDDFLVVGKSKEECNNHLNNLMTLVRRLGFSINYGKVSAPTKRIVFLGIVLDTEKMTLELPQVKLKELETLLKQTICRQKITKRSLQSLAGKLTWASQCIYGGRYHVRRIQDKINSLSAPRHYTRVTCDMKADMWWWISFMSVFNGSVPMLEDRTSSLLYVDACPVASGAVHGDKFLYTPWASWHGSQELHINYKETLSLEPAATYWAPQWTNKKVFILCDNQAAVSIINRGTSRNRFVMDSLRRVFWLSAIYNFRLHAIYLPGRHNYVADAVSRLHEPYNVLRSKITVP